MGGGRERTGSIQRVAYLIPDEEDFERERQKMKREIKRGFH